LNGGATGPSPRSAGIATFAAGHQPEQRLQGCSMWNW
jgi:hypothetical protein